MFYRCLSLAIALALNGTAWAISSERFASLDPNGDGKISKEEFKGAPLVFEKLDLNKDGFLDVKEAAHLRRAERGSIPVPENIEVLGDLVYKTVGNQKVALDLYRLKGKKYDKAPVLIWIHGGGYRQGDKKEAVKNDSNIFVPLLEEHGYLVVSLNYRLTPSGASFVDCYTDCKDAVRFLVKNSEVYGIDAVRMVSFGSSAGGGLALILALTRDSDLPGDPERVNDWSGGLNRQRFWAENSRAPSASWDGWDSRSRRRSTWPLASPTCSRLPVEAGRLIRVGLSGSDTAPSPAWIKAADFQYGYYFSNVSGNKADFEIQVEGGEPVWISSVAAYAHPDAMYREFEHGLVLANPSPRPYTFDLTGLLPGKCFRRFKGTPNQDLATNSGAAVAGQVTLGPKDALFLVKVDR